MRAMLCPIRSGDSPSMLGVWTVACPCNGIPGFVLLGPVHSEPVTDWKFVNDVPLCQIQISTGMKRATPSLGFDYGP